MKGLGGFLGRVLLPLGLFSILAVGLHVGSDRIDDHLFVLFSWLDGFLDGATAFVIRGVFGLFGSDEASIERWTFRAAELIDVDVKSLAARWGALFVELAADFILALPVFFHRGEAIPLAELRTLLEKMFRDPTVLKFSGPLAVLAAGLAGAIAVSRELQVLSHSQLLRFDPNSDLASFIASAIGFLALSLVAWRVLVPLLIGAVRFADRRSNNDVVLSVPARTRRLRGTITALVALPVALLALDTTPLLGTLRALLWI